MDVASPRQGNSPTTKSSNPKQNILEQKHECGFGDLPSEVTEVAFPGQENSLTMKSPTKHNNLEQNHESGFVDVQSEAVDVTSPSHENILTTKSPSPKLNVLDKKIESGFGDVQDEAMDLTLPKQENSLTIKSLSPKLDILEEKHECSIGYVQSEPMDVAPVIQESSLTTECPIPEVNILEQKYESGFGGVQGKAMDVASSRQKNSIIATSLSPKLNIIEQEHKLESAIEGVQSEAMDVAPVTQENSLTTECPIPEVNILEQTYESGFGDVQGKAMDIASPRQENSIIAKSSSPKLNIMEHKHEFAIEGAESEAFDVAHVTQENSPTPKGPNPKLNILEQKYESGFVDIQGESMDIASPRQENGLIVKSSSPKLNSLEQKLESGIGDVQTEVMDVSHVTQEICPTTKSSSPTQKVLEENHESGIGGVQCAAADTQKVLEENHESGIGGVQCAAADVTHPAQENSLSTNNSSPKKNILEQIHESGFGDVQNEAMDGNAERDFVDEKLLETPSDNMMKNSISSSRKRNRFSSKSKKKNYMLRSSLGSTRVLRSRLQDTSKAPDPSSISVNVNTERDKKRKKRKKAKNTANDEFATTRRRVRYLLHRMRYEHSLIEAYSGEGWKGQSAEKIRPEKELQRATSEILRCKLKIRELFQHLDSLCAEGRFQESLFDSDGLIYSEDIFCAKCRSKDLSADNDIILCDGICNRGFHQMCLDPPLLKEEIPPGDEGWLCPGCDCKVDCFDLLNDDLGMDLSINDNWEKVFPEVANTAAGNKLDDNFGFPSDDSEDNDYDPDCPEVDDKVEADGSSSDESDFTSASDDSENLPHEEQYLGLPSDDSEDDDYNPNAPDPDDDVNKESSSSDFTSDSGDSGPLSDGNESPGTDKIPMPSLVDGADPLSASGHRKSTEAKRKKQRVNSELQSILEQGNVSPVSGRRHREQLDYKKLHDETYGNVPSDSSDDEDWMDADGPETMEKDSAGKESVVPTKGNSRTTRSGANARNTKRILEKADNNQKKSRQKLEPGGANNTASDAQKEGLDPGSVEKKAKTSTHSSPGQAVTQKKSRKKLEPGGANNTASDTQKEGLDPGSVEKKAKTSTRSSLGQAVIQRLFESLKKNEYPSRETKEKLAEESGITVRQVSKWFENTRWSLRHPSGRIETASPKKANPTLKVGKTPEPEPEPKILPSDSASKRVQGRQLGETGKVDTVVKEHMIVTASPKKAKQTLKVGKTPEPESKILPSDSASKRVQGRQLGETSNVDTVAKEHMIVTASPKKANQAPKVGKTPEPESKILPSNSAGKRVQGRQLGETGNIDTVVKEHMFEQSTPQKSSSPKLKNRRNSNVGGKTLDVSVTHETPTTCNSTDSDRVLTPRRSSRNKKQEVVQSQIRTRSRKAVT